MGQEAEERRERLVKLLLDHGYGIDEVEVYVPRFERLIVDGAVAEDGIGPRSEQQ